MALTERVVVVANKGRRKRGNVAKHRRKMSAKQIRIFGTKAQKAALKRRRPAARKSNSSHRRRTAKRNAPARRRNSAHSTVQRFFRPRRRKSSAAKHHRRPNLGGIFALTNPAKGHKMATTNRRRRRHHSTAGTPRRRRRLTAVHHRRHHRPNPGTYGTPTDWLFGGVGVLAGVIGTRAIPQMVLGANNTGPIGYFANAASTAILTFAAHMASPKNHVLAAAVLAGGSASILSRIIQDYSLLGSYSSQVGLGDYLMSDFLTPQLVSNGLHTAALNRPSWYAPPAAVPVNVAGAPSLSGITGGALY